MSGLKSYINQLASKHKSKFFNRVLPFIIKLALDLPKLVKKPVPLLVPQKKQTVTLTQMQVGSLMANAFLCTLPKQGKPSKEKM